MYGKSYLVFFWYTVSSHYWNNRQAVIVIAFLLRLLWLLYIQQYFCLRVSPFPSMHRFYPCELTVSYPFTSYRIASQSFMQCNVVVFSVWVTARWFLTVCYVIVMPWIFLFTPAHFLISTHGSGFIWLKLKADPLKFHPHALLQQIGIAFIKIIINLTVLNLDFMLRVSIMGFSNWNGGFLNVHMISE